MESLLRSDVWLLLILGVVFALLLIYSQTPDNAAKLAAFFEVLGDGMALLALGTGGSAPVSN